MERSRDWMDQEGKSGSPKDRYIEEEARRLFNHAHKIIEFCSDFLSKI